MGSKDDINILCSVFHKDKDIVLYSTDQNSVLTTNSINGNVEDNITAYLMARVDILPYERRGLLLYSHKNMFLQSL